MKIPAVALFERTLRLESRSGLMSLARVGLLVLILFELVPVQAMGRAGLYGAPGLTFLQEMVWVNLVFITLAGLSYFASVITEEKEEMMLGLLRMTDLNPIAILLGKSTSRLVGSLLLLLTQVPFVLLAVTLGGVSVVQIAAAYATLLAYLFLLSNLALLCSVVFRNTRIAGATTFALILLFFSGCYLVQALESWLAFDHGINLQKGIWPAISAVIRFWRQTIPSERLIEIFRTGFAGPAIGFQVASNLVLGIVLFLVSWAVFDRCTREEKDAAPARRWFFRRTSRASRMPPGLTGPIAITWKDFTFMNGGKLGLLLKFFLILLIISVINLLAWRGNRGQISREFESGLLIWVSLITTAVMLSFDAARIFNEEVRWKTLSSLVTLPISICELVYRKAAGALMGTLPLLVLFVIGIMLDPEDVGKFVKQLANDPVALGTFTAMVFQYILFLHLTAFLSLVLKRGALPIAMAIQYLGGSFFIGIGTFIFFRTRSDAIWFLIASFCIVATAFLHVGIKKRLTHVAAQE